MSGPFGNYKAPSIGHVMNSLVKFGVPVNVVETVVFGKDEITYNGKPFAVYKYFKGIEQPLFRFLDETYSRVFAQQNYVINGDKTLSPRFKLTLSNNNTPGLIIAGKAACPKVHAFITSLVMCNFTDDVEYKITSDAGAIFQSGSYSPDDVYIFIEFWKHKGAQAFVDYINENFKMESN